MVIFNSYVSHYRKVIVACFSGLLNGLLISYPHLIAVVVIFGGQRCQLPRNKRGLRSGTYQKVTDFIKSPQIHPTSQVRVSKFDWSCPLLHLLLLQNIMWECQKLVRIAFQGGDPLKESNLLFFPANTIQWFIYSWSIICDVTHPTHPTRKVYRNLSRTQNLSRIELTSPTVDSEMPQINQRSKENIWHNILSYVYMYVYTPIYMVDCIFG